METNELSFVSNPGVILDRILTVFAHQGRDAAKAKSHHLLVVDDGELQGVVSDRDLLRALNPSIDSVVEAPRDVATLTNRVHQIMSRKPITLQPGADVSDAISVFLSRPILCIPIVDYGFRPIGIVSWRDIPRSWPGAAPTPQLAAE
jgi:acetoin utilization protein AcuB